MYNIIQCTIKSLNEFTYGGAARSHILHAKYRQTSKQNKEIGDKLTVDADSVAKCSKDFQVLRRCLFVL